MSSSIVYVRQFLRLPDKRIIPMCLYGDNRTYERDGRERRRARSWNVLGLGENNAEIALTPEKLIAKFQTWTGGPYQEHFIYHGKWVDDAGLIRFIKKGIQEAMTLEELQEHFPSLHLVAGFSCWLDEGKTYPDGSVCPTNRHEFFSNLTSSEDLLLFISRAEQRMAEKGERDGIFALLSYPSEDSQYTKLRRDIPKPRWENDYYVLEADSGRYIRKLICGRRSRSIRLTFSLEDAKQFRTERAADRWLAKHPWVAKAAPALEKKHITYEQRTLAA